MCHHNPITPCLLLLLLTLPILTQGYGKKQHGPPVYSAKFSPYKHLPAASYKMGHYNKGMYGNAGFMGYGTGLKGYGVGSYYGGGASYGLATNHLLVGQYGGFMPTSQINGGYYPSYMLNAMKTYAGTKPGVYGGNYGRPMYPAMLNKHYSAVASHIPGYLGSGGGMYYSKYGGQMAYPSAHPGIGGYGQGYFAGGYVGGNHYPVGGYQSPGYYAKSGISQSHVVPKAGYRGPHVNMLGRTLTPYG